MVNDNNSFHVDAEVTNDFTPDHLNLGYYNINKTDWPLANEFLSGIDWNDLFNNQCSIDYCWETFYSVIVYTISLFTPVRLNSDISFRRPRRRFGKPRKLYPKYIRKLSNKKTNSWRRYRSRPSLRRKATYKKHATTYILELNKYISSVENKLISSNNCRSFFNYVNKKIKAKGSIPALTDSAKNVIVDNLQKANMFSSHFSSVYVVDNSAIPCQNSSSMVDNTSDNELESVYFTSTDVFIK